MKSIYRFGTYGLFAGLFAFVSGCASEKISVDYVMPAKAVTVKVTRQKARRKIGFIQD